MPLQQTSGNATQDAFGGGVAVVPTYIEDIFSTWLYTGNGSTQTITNNIDLSTKGGLTWIKGRSGATDHKLTDTARGATKALKSNSFAIETTDTTGLTAFGTTGFTIGADADYNTNAATYASWTFGKQPKFFDVVTYTGDLTSNRAIPHSLGSAPGMIIIKRRDGAITNWKVFHRSNPNDNFVLDDTAGANVGGYAINFGANQPTASNFYVTNNGSTNGSGQTFVAYLFAHNAGGFGLTGTDNVISCGSFTTTTSPDTITLGYEPQWVLIKSANSATNWYIFDNMRGIPTGGLDSRLMPNLSAVESTDANYLDLTATGFTSNFQSIFGDGINLIYIAIRRGPMKVPTLGTSVFTPVTQAGGGFDTAGFPVDLLVLQGRSAATGATWTDRLRGSSAYFNSSSTAAESNTGGIFAFDNQTGVQDNYFGSGTSVAYWNMRRAPSFFDEVCYTGTGVRPLQLNHNLGAVPELMIVKIRATAAQPWFVYSSALGNTQYLSLNTTAAFATSISAWSNTTPTSTTFTVGDFDAVNGSTNYTYVAYLFATCAGVSKVGTYTGNGTTQTIDCGFTGGARFVLIKRTDASGDWYTYDTARGMTVLTDPYLLMNSTAAETATLGSVTTVSTGFALNSAILAAINVSAGSYIFLAIS